MNISSVKVALSGLDLLSMANEFVNVEGLNLQKIEIEDEIRLYGSFTKGITINFAVGVKLSRVEDGIVHGEVSFVKVAKLKIFSIARKAALKFALKSLEEKGISYKDGKVVINIKYLLKDVPYIDLDISDIYFTQDLINIDVSNINLSIKGTLIKENPLGEEDKKKQSESKEDFELIEENIVKVKDHYSRGRNFAVEKLPKKIKTYSDYLFIVPDMAALLYRLLKDKRVSTKTKIIISAAIAYTAFPRDIIPDKIPFIGKVDEIAVAFFALERVISDVPVQVVLENWEGKNDIVFVLRNSIEYVVNFTGARNVEKIYNFIEEIVSL
ncbi:YkvA family protein [Clostridium sp. HCS.1]|uniref:YkvA family protein n=1 Tax=Clostridium sp. HCS.1 TaxID=3238594 RepID=UPI003A0FDDE8